MYAFNQIYDFSLRSSTVSLNERCWFAHFKIEGDFLPLFPFIQSIANEAAHYESPEYLHFRLHGFFCALYPPNIVVARFFDGKEQALEFAHKLIEFLNDLEARRSQIKPVYRKIQRLHVPEILRFLPMIDCGQCGFKTCMAFAGALSCRKTKLIMCPHFPEPVDVKIIFATDDKDPNKTRKIEVDGDLAGVTIDKNKTQADIFRQPDLKTPQKRSKGLVGKREGIIFKLSGREIEVLRLIAEGFTNKEIAQLLELSSNTVKSHVMHIFNKLGIGDRTQAAVWAAQNDLI